MKLINDPPVNRDHVADLDADVRRVDAGMEELIRRARLQAGELSVMIQRMERLRRDIRQHLNGASGFDPPQPYF